MKQPEALAKESSIHLASHKSCIVHIFFCVYELPRHILWSCANLRAFSKHAITCAVSSCQLSCSTCFSAYVSADFALNVHGEV